MLARPDWKPSKRRGVPTRLSMAGRKASDPPTTRCFVALSQQPSKGLLLLLDFSVGYEENLGCRHLCQECSLPCLFCCFLAEDLAGPQHLSFLSSFHQDGLHLLSLWGNNDTYCLSYCNCSELAQWDDGRWRFVATISFLCKEKNKQLCDGLSQVGVRFETREDRAVITRVRVKPFECMVYL